MPFFLSVNAPYIGGSVAPWLCQCHLRHHHTPPSSEYSTLLILLLLLSPSPFPYPHLFINGFTAALKRSPCIFLSVVLCFFFARVFIFRTKFVCVYLLTDWYSIFLASDLKNCGPNPSGFVPRTPHKHHCESFYTNPRPKARWFCVLFVCLLFAYLKLTYSYLCRQLSVLLLLLFFSSVAVFSVSRWCRRFRLSHTSSHNALFTVPAPPCVTATPPLNFLGLVVNPKLFNKSEMFWRADEYARDFV